MNLKFSKGLRGLPVLLLLILSFASLQVSAQNCTVNAGVPESICPGQKMVLKGVYTGLFTSTAVWSQVGGPAVTIGTPVISGSDITANVTGFSPGNVYTFRISARCQDGSQVFQDVVFTTLAATKATVGANITSCPGLVTLTGNAPIGGGTESGDWSIISRAYGMHINTSSSPTSTVSLPTDSTASVVFKWTIINTNGCASAAQMTITNIGANPVISAGGNQSLGNCYNLTQATDLFASYGGNGFMGQQGTWSFVSGPGTPTFGNIHANRTTVSNLVTGVYRLRWTVSGPCANGSAEMTITVPPPTQSVTNSGSANLIFCDGRTSTVLNATIPGYTNEVGTWAVINGSATLSDLHAPSILVTDLVAPNFTRLRYTIHNSITNCTTSGDFNITYSPQVSVAALNGPITVLPSTATAVSIPYTVTGGNQTLWQLVAGPLGATLAVSGTTAYQNIDESPIDLTGLDKVGTYNFRLARVTNNAGQGGCENAFADLAVVISQPPTAANAGTSGAVACNVFTTTLAGNAPSTGSGYWSQVSGPSVVVFADIYDRATGISNLTSGSYTFRWIITGGYGAIDAQADVNVSVASAVPTTADAGPTQMVCNQTPIKLAGNTPALNETGTWTIVPVTGTFVNIHDPNTKLTGLADNSSYTLTWTITNSCGTSASTTTITTSNTAGPKAAVAGSPQCLSSTATVFNLSGNAPSGLETGLWSLVSGPNTPFITSTSSNTTTVTGVVNGVYKFEWSLNTPTCTATRDTVIITASAAATTATVTITPVNLCNATGLTLAGNTPVIGTGKWTQVGGPGGAVITDPFSPTSTVTGLVAGSYIFRWTISNGSCSSNSADVKYNNSAPPVTPTVDVDQEICGVASTVLTGNVINPGQGLWKVVSGPNTPAFSSFTNPTATISGLVTGIYKLIWTSSNGANCGISESRTLNVTVRANATASVASSGLCNATVAQLTGNNGSSGTWTYISGSGPSDPTLTPNSNFTAIASNLINGTYTFKYTIPASGACVVTSSATVSINITASPSAAQAGLDQALCSATFVALSAVTPDIGTGTWTIISQPGTGAAFVNSHSPTTNISTATAGVYLLQWNVTNGNCGTNQDIVRITTSSPPTTSVAGANQLTACSGNLTLIANTPSIGVGTWTQVTSMTGTIDAENSAVTAVLGTIPGAYTFMWTIANGSCPASTSTVDITVSSIPPNPARSGPAQSICNVSTTATATLAGSSPIAGETGVWTIASKPGGASPAFTNATLFNTTVTNLIQGEYQFTWTVSNGSCVSNSTVTITVTDQPTPASPGADQSICLYTPVLLHATAVTVGVGTWSVTSQPISTPEVVFSDVNSPTTDVNGLTAGDYTFTWITTNGSACATSMSNTTVHIVQPPTPALAGSFQTVCLGVNPVLAANSPTFGIGTWAVVSSAGGTPAFSPSANANNAMVTGLVAGNYTFSWTITSGGCTSEDYMQVTVQPAIGNNQIETPQTICSGTTPAGLTGTAVTGGNGTTYNYQWQQSTTSDVAGFANIPSATAATYGPGTLTTTTWYRRIVSSGACAPGTFSNTLEVTVQPPLANNVITAPITATFCQTGDPDVITGLSATGGDGITYNYQWEQSTTSASAGFTAITGAISLDYDPATLTVSTWFRRRVSSGACAVITSPAVKITINPYATLTSIQALTPVCNGTTVNYSPTASIAGTTFAWTRDALTSINANAAGSGTGIINESLTSTDVVPVPVTYLYSLTVTGCTNPMAYSVTVVINPTPVVTLPSNEIVCNGTLTTAVVFTGSPVANTTYNWTNNTTSIGLAASGSGTINAFTAINNTNAPVTASITVTPASNTCNGTAETFTIVVNPTAFAVTVSQSICSGASFTVSPTNGSGNIIPAGTTYSWGAPTGAASADGTPGTAAGSITGTLAHTSNTALTALYMVTPGTTACGDGPVFSVTITVNPVAAITPISITTCAGVIFDMTPTQTTNGVVPAGTVYSWAAPAITGGLIGGTAGTNLSNLRGTLYNTTTFEATATYSVVPSSGTCTGMTFIATATVLPRAVIISQMTATTCSGVAFDFTPTDAFGGNIIPAGTTYSWPAPTGASLSGGITQTGVDHVFGTFNNSSNIARPVVYNIVPLSGLCTGVTYTVTVSILPIVNITTPTFSRAICSGTMFSVTPTDGVNGIVPATTQYRWSAPVTTGTLTGISTSTNSSQITGTLNNPGTTAETATFTVTPSTSCGDGASFTVVVTVYPIAAITPMSLTTCGGVAFAVSPTLGVDGNFPVGTRYTWSAPPGGVNFSGGGTASLSTTISGNLLNTSNAVRTATYLVTPVTTAGCAGAVFSVTVNINPTAQIAAMTNVICNGSSFTSTPANIVNGIVPSGSTYEWLAPTGTGFTGGLTGTGASITGTLANSTSSAHSATYIVTPTSGSCTGNTFTIVVTVNPIAAVNEMTATTCSGVAFSSTPVDVTNGTIPAGTLYTWNAPTGTGFINGLTQVSGVSNINGLLTNITTTAVIAVYTVTPTSGSCAGAQFTLTVTVNPSAAVIPMSTTICGGSPFIVTPTNLTDGRVPPATTYTWLSLPTPTGVGFTGGMTAAGAANIAGTLLNTVNTVRTATYLVTPLTGACTGAVFSVTVNINPLAQVNAITRITCDGVTFAVSPVNGTNGIVPAGINYSWTVFSVTGGVTGATGGTGQPFISGTLTNPTNTQQTVTYTVTPNTTTCGNGATFTVTISVNPSATVTDMTAVTCGGVAFIATPTVGTIPAGTRYAWSLPTGAGFTGGATGTNALSITGTLVNTTNVVTIATYTVTTLSGNCVGAPFTLTLTLNPKAIISQLSMTTCSGIAFAVTPVSIVPAGTTYSWIMPTGSNLSTFATGSAQPDINGLLINSVNVARTATYTVTPLSGSCTGNVFSVVITVNPRANITGITNTTCSGVMFTVSPTNLTNGVVPAGTTYTWGVPTLTGSLSGEAGGSGASFISGTLTNSSSVAQSATYTVTPSSACGDGPAFTVVVTVNPAANISTINTVTCSAITFTVTPTDPANGTIPAGTTYTWGTPAITGGITGGAARGAASATVFGLLTNPTNAVQTATYTVTPLSGSCTGAQFSVVVTLNPKATITAMANTTCNGVLFTSTPLQGTNGTVPTGTTYTWILPTGTGISNGATGTGAGITGILTNTTNIARTATYTVTPLSGSCTGANFTLVVTVSPSATINALNSTVCSGSTFTVSPTTADGIVPTGTLYSWGLPGGTGFINGATGTTLGFISGTLVNTTNAAVTATYIVSTVSAGCAGQTFTLVVTVNPLATISPMSTTVCGGTPFTVAPADVTNGIIPVGTRYSWTLPTPGITAFSGGMTGTLAASIQGTLLNTVNAPRTATYIVTPTTLDGCVGAVFSVTVNINPTAQIAAMTNVICNGSSFTSTPANIVNGIIPSGSTYEWLAPTGTGFTGGSTGTGVFITGTLANSSNIAHSATYIVTPTSGGCTGNTFTIVVTVNPIAAVTDMTATTCSGVSFNSIPLDVTNGTIPAGTLYSWNAPLAPGITGGATQLSAIASITGLLTNTTIATAVAVYTVTPTSNGCVGAQFTLTVTLEPSAAVTAMATTVCGGSPFTVTPTNITDGRVPPATTYSWLAPAVNGFSGGISATGSADIHGTLLNTTNAVRTATYLVTPLTGGCTGAVFTVTVNLNPLAQVTSMSAITCSGTAFNMTPVNVTNGIVPSGITYSWVVDNVTGGITGATGATGQTVISGTLLNPTSTQQTATYTVTPNTAACGNGASFTVTVSVNPTATVTTQLSATTCGGVAFSVTPTNVTDGNLPTGTKFSWSLPTGANFTGGATGSNALAVTGLLTNTSSTVTTAFYSVTTVSGFCTGAAFTVTVTLNPKAIITQMTGTTCSGTFFAVTPTDITNGIVPNGTTYSWGMPTGSNFTGLATGSGQTNINGTLTNGVNVARTATYIVTPSSVTGVCAGNVFSIVVTVDPRAYITAITNITCSGVAFQVSPTNLTNGVVPVATTYRWSTPSLTGSLTGEASGSGASFISGTLSNTSNVAQTATYTVIPTNACGDGASFTVTVTVKPAAIVSTINTATCSAITFTVTPTDPANGTIPTGTTYTWGTPVITGGITGGTARGTPSATVFGLLTNPTNAMQTATYTVTPLSGNCTGAQFSVVVTLNPVAIITVMTNSTCNGVLFTVTPLQTVNGTVPAGTTYTWILPTGTGISNGATGTGAGITGTLINTTNIARTATYAVTPLSGSCTGGTFTLVVTVTPAATINALNSTVCSGATFTVSPTITDGIVPSGTLYSWGSPDGTGFTGGATGTSAAFISGTLVNTTSAAVTATYIVSTVSAGCTGATFTLVVTVNPTPALNAITNQVICNGLTTTTVSFTGAVINTTYNWANTLTSIGLAASGSGTINGFAATNPLAVPVEAVITVTPVSNTCVGSSITFSITVNPTPTVNTITSQALCNGAGSTAVNFTGFVANTVYTWVNTNAAIGIGALTGTGNISSFIATNPTAIPIQSIITITPFSNTCTGASRSFSITVNPTPAADQIGSQVICNGTLTSAVAFTGFVAGTTYSWTNNTTSIGLAASGTGTIAAFTGTNVTSSPVTAVITVTPSSNTCTGATMAFTITVNPSATLTSSLTPTAICSNTAFSYTATSAVSGTSFAWSRTTVSGITSGGAATGTGDINQTLINSNNTQTNVAYVYTLTANGCTNPMTFTVTVPVSAVASVNAVTAVSCAGVTFTKTPVNITDGIVPSGTTYTWSAPAQTGVSGGVAQGSAVASLTGTLVNTTNAIGTAVYIVTPVSGACTGTTFTLTVTIDPKAVINPLTATICSGATFTVTPSDITNGIVPVGTTYSWNAPVATGITGAVTGSGAASISGTLVNTTNIARTITYTVTPLSGSCTGQVFTVTVTIDPTPSINTMTRVSASGGTFFASPLNGTDGIVPFTIYYTWTVPVVTGGMTGNLASSASFVTGGLTNPTNSVQTATYTATPIAGSCVGATFTVIVTVYPVASVNALTVTTCSGVAFSITPTHPTDGNIPAGTVYRWSTPAGTGFTGGAGAISQTTVGGSLVNTTTAPVTATYIVTPTSAGYDGKTFTVTVTVNPTPVLSSTLTPADVCSGSTFVYPVTSATTGSVFTWSRTTVTGITSGGAATGTGDINQSLFNNTTSPLSINYAYAITANGCTNPSAGTVTVIVNPIPVLNSTLTPADIYNATTFNYTATSLTPGTTFAWSRAAIAAINSNTTGSGVGATISETLTTTMPSLTGVVYAITLTANGCTNAQTITVNVSPTPALSSPLNPAAICSGTVFGYTSTSATPATTFTWTRAAIASINSNATGSGSSGTINETLTNSSNVPVSVVYTVLLTSNSFTNTQNVTVVVNPTPSVTYPGAQIVCNNSLTAGVTFSGSVAGAVYNWTNNNTAIGLASAGSATINAFTATNSTTSPITAIITVTPVSNTCAGPATTFTITVNPTPVLSSTLAPTGICTGTAFSYTATSATTGTSFSWSRTTVNGITSGGPATGTGDVTGQSHINNTTAPISVQYVYTLSAGSCANIQTVTLAVNPTPVLSSTLSPTAVFGGTPFVYTPTSVTTSTTFTWSRAAITGISNAASSGTGTINESLINTTPSPISVVYSFTSTAAGCATSQTVTVSIIPSNIDAVTDDFRTICIDGGKGGNTTTVLANDILNSTVVDPALVNMSIVSDGGITGLTINALGELVVPAKTFEGTYTVTYNICVTANPGNCDQATATITVCRGLYITTTAVCIHDVPYVHYKVVPNFNPATSSPVTLKWLNGDKTVLSAQPVVSGTALEADVLWPGAVVDSAGNPTDWPGWFISNGLWVAGADGFEGTRPNAYLVVSVNPTDTVLLSYPPATPGCAVNPVNRPPVAVDDRDSAGQCSAIIINVLNNDTDFENGTLTVSLPSATSLHNGTAVVNANGTVTYTPPTDYVGEDKFTYTITDAAGLTSSATVTITIASKPQIAGGISGVCALSKDSSAIYSVLPVANATSYLWTLPSGWTGSSTTNSITAKAGAANGTITVVPYNGGCAGTAVTYNVAIIDYAKVTLTASPSTVKGDGVATSQITIQLFDPNGNPIHCSGGTATLCTSSGVFSDVVDNGDGTYTGYLRSSANAAIICGTVAGKRIEQNITTTFTGPQGSIKGNGPIFETETPLLTFNFSAGIGPFTVIYKPEGATKTDTLTNVVSNVPVPVKAINATKLYTMVSIIGSDNARRDNNFTRDTATILVVEPKIVITLTADNPKFLADNLYSTILRMKVKNIGAIDLASVQVRADLTDVFPNPVQFILDSVKQAGIQTVPNGRYDGRSNLDLFSWNFNSTPGLRNNMNDVASAQVPGFAYGNSSSSIGLNNTDGAGEERTQVPFLPGYHTTTEKENTTGTGNNDGPTRTPFFYGALSKLDVGEESEMQLYIRIVPNGYFKPFVMQAVAVGTGHTEFGTSLANSLSNDDGNESLHPENTHNGDPLPTVINVFPNPVLGVSMNASTPVLQGNGTYNVTLNYLLKNYGNVNLRQVKLFEELTRSIGSPATFSVISAPVTTGNLIANPSYNGVSDTTMLAANSSIGVGTDATVTLTINITPNQLSALYRAFAIATGFNIELNNTITDISTNGTDPDPDGNEIPDEKLITLIPINMSIPPLVPGTIGIQDTPSTTVLTKVICGTSVVTVVPNVAPAGGLDPIYTYQWQSSVDNVTFAAITGATGSSYTGTIAASVYLRRIVYSGSQQGYSNSVHIVINAIAKPVITASGSLNLTQSGSITLTSSSASAYLWSTNATTGTIAVSTAGAYTVTITDANGCKATSDLVAINPPPPTTVNRTYVVGGIGNPPNSGIQVTGLTGATLKYYLVSTGGALIPVPVLPGVIGTYPYYVSQVVNGYESVLVPYTVTMIAPAQLADIQKITSKAPELQADGSYLVNFTIRATNLMTQQLDSVKIKDDLRAVFPTAVQFEVVGVKTSGKLIANELYNGNSQIELLADGSVLPASQKDSIILTVKVTPNGFSGQLKNTAIQIARSPYGVFSVTSNDPALSNGITLRAPTEFVIPATDIFIPSGFSPNRDGVNDVFVITRPFNTTINMEIYNRWGNLVYRSRDYNNDWGGKGNQPNNILGEDLPDGTYYYVVLATDKATGTVRKFAAFITLKR